MDGKSTMCDSESSWARGRADGRHSDEHSFRFGGSPVHGAGPGANSRVLSDVLGFQIAGYWDGRRVSLVPDTPPVFAIVWRDQVQVFFNRADQPDARTGRADGACDAYFRVTGIDALAEELRTRGADIIDGPEDRIYGQREVVIRDCNDLILCFGEARGRQDG